MRRPLLESRPTASIHLRTSRRLIRFAERAPQADMNERPYKRREWPELGLAAA